MLAKYKAASHTVSPFVQMGPAFRASGNVNGSSSSAYGGTVGLGVEAHVGKLTVLHRYATRIGRQMASLFNPARDGIKRNGFAGRWFSFPDAASGRRRVCRCVYVGPPSGWPVSLLSLPPRPMPAPPSGTGSLQSAAS